MCHHHEVTLNLVFSCFKESCPKNEDAKVLRDNRKPIKTKHGIVIQKWKQDLRVLPFVMRRHIV
jgi:hypothetical protein